MFSLVYDIVIWLSLCIFLKFGSLLHYASMRTGRSVPNDDMKMERTDL